MSKIFAFRIEVGHRIDTHSWIQAASPNMNCWYILHPEGKPTKVEEDEIATKTITEYTEQASLADCQANPQSWYWDSTNERLYIHTTNSDNPVGQEVIDDFEDGVRDPVWTDEPNNGTIVESGGVLTLSIANGIHGDFWQDVEDGPVCWLETTIKSLTVITKLNDFTLNNCTRAGIYITDAISGWNGFHFGRFRWDAGGKNGLEVIKMGDDDLAYVNLNVLPVWLKVIINGSGLGSTMKFQYSINGEDYFDVYELEDQTWSYIGLLAFNWFFFNSISAPFEFFKWDEYFPDSPKYLLQSYFWDCYADDSPVEYENKYFEPRMNSKDMPSIKLAVSGYHEGKTIQSFGSIKLINADGHFDSRLNDYIYEAKKAEMRFGELGDAWGDLILIWEGWTGGITWTDEEIEIEAKDLRSSTISR